MNLGSRKWRKWVKQSYPGGFSFFCRTSQRLDCACVHLVIPLGEGGELSNPPLREEKARGTKPITAPGGWTESDPLPATVPSQHHLGRATWPGSVTLRLLSSSLSKMRASLVAQLVKNPPAMQETWVQSLGWEDPLEKGKAPHSSSLAWRIPWTV